MSANGMAELSEATQLERVKLARNTAASRVRLGGQSRRMSVGRALARANAFGEGIGWLGRT